MVEKRRTVVDRRSGKDRRTAYHLDYFSTGGAERRVYKERRSQLERRTRWMRVNRWSSVFPWGTLKDLKTSNNTKRPGRVF